jgi:hypothetical protein
MDVIIESALKTLSKTKSLLVSINDDILSNTSVSPYYSSIGSHIRHILDFYNCILNIDLDKKIDLTDRSRDKKVEHCCGKATDYLNLITGRLKNIDYEVKDTVFVTDDLGLGKIEMPYTLAAVLSQANSHTIHHFAIINYILDRLGILMNDDDFGYNPSTPKQIPLNN